MWAGIWIGVCIGFAAGAIWNGVMQDTGIRKETVVAWGLLALVAFSLQSG